MATQRTPRFSRALVLVSLLCAVSACGSTVGQAARGSADAQGGDALTGTSGASTPVSGTTGAATAPGSSSSTGTTGGLSGGSAAGTGSGGGAPAGGGTSTADPLPTAGSVKVPAKGRVQIGFLVTKCSNCSALGSGYVAPAHSEQDVLQALVNDANKHGGFLGRQITPVFAVEDTAAADASTQIQSICATFTQDHHVLAVLGAGVSYADQLADCLGKAGVLTIDATRSTGVPSDYQLRRRPGWILSNEPSADAYALVALTSAVADGWLTTKTKLGIFTSSCPETQRVYNSTIAPYLKANHFTATTVYSASCPAGAADYGRAAQDVSSAELKMRAAGVDTVVITDVPLVVFAEAAASQQYHPHYLASEGGAGYQAYLSTDQLKNIHSAGWEPTYDLDAQHQPALTPTQKACLAALTRGGLTGTTASEYTMYFSLCGGFQLYEAAVTKAQSLGTTQVLSATDALASTFTSPMLLGGRTLLKQGKHGAPVDYRSVLFNGACSCFKYQGPVRQLPETG